ncbi:MFS transporter [Pedococcus sp. 2YAF34]|uniref:MFS transporter n=1 Tax=Pedococcus sp. 2YAF34 TaxID=3233032 RepID=UPI003F98601D
MTDDTATAPLLERVVGPPGPARRLLLATVAESTGFGALLTVSIIYFTTVVGLPAVQVGAVMTASGLCSLALGVPLGALADGFGARRMLVAGLCAQAVGVAVLLTVRSLWAYAVVVIAVGLADRVAYGARGALMARIFTGERVASRARLRAGQNIGVSLGGAVGALALHANTPGAYRAVIGVNALAFVVSAWLAQGLPPLDQAGAGKHAGSTGRRSRLVVHRDRRFVGAAALNAVLCLHYGLFEVAMPLWVVRETDAPRALVGVLFIVNTALVVLFQVRMSRGSESARGGARSSLAGAALVLVSTLLFASATHSGSVGAVALLVAATVVYVFGEMSQAAGSWGVSYALSPEDRHGEYQSAFGSAASGGMLLAPLLATAVTIRPGGAGWLVSGAVVLLAGVALWLFVLRVGPTAGAADGAEAAVGTDPADAPGTTTAGAPGTTTAGAPGTTTAGAPDVSVAMTGRPTEDLRALAEEGH